MRVGPCMCGDTHCPSCGPAQGNWKCPICRAWADDGCEHIDDDGNLRPEFQAQADALAESERMADEQFAKDLEEEERLAEAYWNQQKLHCRVCGREILTAELCKDCAKGNDPFLQSKYSDGARGTE